MNNLQDLPVTITHNLSKSWASWATSVIERKKVKRAKKALRQFERSGCHRCGIYVEERPRVLLQSATGKLTADCDQRIRPGKVAVGKTGFVPREQVLQGDDDRRWFEKRPGATARVRAPLPGEVQFLVDRYRLASIE